MADPNKPDYSVISLGMIKDLYLKHGCTREEIAKQLAVPIDFVNEVIETNSLEAERAHLAKKGLDKLQSKQMTVAQKAMDLEVGFKQMRLVQLEKQLADFAAYYQLHGDFYKRNPSTGDVLKDTDGMPLQLKIPSVARELSHIKETINLSEGLKRLLTQVNDIINTPKKSKNVNDELNIKDVNKLFEKRRG